MSVGCQPFPILLRAPGFTFLRASVRLCAVGGPLGDFGIGVGETGRLEVRGWGFPERSGEGCC